VYHLLYALFPKAEDLEAGEVKLAGYPFQDTKQLSAHLNEIGWAFFGRIEATFEALYEKLAIKKEKVEKIVEDSAELSAQEKKLYLSAMELRNALFHGDGDHRLLRKPTIHFQFPESLEPEVSREDMKMYADLFRNIGDLLIERYRHDLALQPPHTASSSPGA
jgi:hypothetical protein